MMAEARIIPAPQPNAETEAFWDAATQGRFLIKRCRACGRPHFYPRALCPFCFSDDTVWEEAAGTGEIYTYSVLRRGPGAPLAIGYVTLDEGPRVLTNFTGDPDALAIGQRVKAVFTPTEGGPPAPMFERV